MAGTIISIELEEQCQSSGQLMNGRVVIVNVNESKVKEVKIFLKGTGQVNWIEEKEYESRSRNSYGEVEYVNRTKAINYNAKEDLISLEAPLLGNGSSLVTLPQGTTTYPFRFAIPQHLPSSYKSKNGEVSYLLEALIRRPLDQEDRTWLNLTVKGKLDLNLDPWVCRPKLLQVTKGSGFFSCWSGQVGFLLKFPNKSGFVPGEILDFQVAITNNSNMFMYGIKASLKCETIYFAKKQTMSIFRNISERHRPEMVMAGEHDMWTPANFKVPNIPPTKLGWNGRLIDVRYSLCIEMRMSGKQTLLSGELPIMIGTIPLRSRPGGSVAAPVGPMPMPLPRALSQSSQGVVNATLPTPSAPYLSDIPPPSFTEAMANMTMSSSNPAGGVPRNPEKNWQAK